jgi:nucleoside-diphosphate-sugar epimerase
MPSLSNSSSVLITGATGFVGGFLCARLLSENISLRGTMLSSDDPGNLAEGVKPVVIEPLGANTQWAHALDGIDSIIHLAARVHIDKQAEDSLREFRQVNNEGTSQLGREAAKAGVKRLVFASTVKVNGEETNIAFNEEAPTQAIDAYGISKCEAEQALRQIEAETGLEVVILRIPLVYGPGVKANFLSMMKAIKRGIPLPLASISNKRSLIYVGNLVDALATCATHHNAAGKTFFVSDGEDVSTPELVKKIASALGVSVRLLPFPLPLMLLAGRFAARSAAVRRLTGSLTVDTSKIKLELNWQPPFTLEEGLRETAKWFNCKSKS